MPDTPTPIPEPGSLSNPLAGNPLRTRDDVARAAADLFTPLLPFFSEGRARVRLSASAAAFDRIAADVEGFARPLWGMTPLAAGGTTFDHWALYREGLANGTDPEHPEFWGHIKGTDQRMVEMAAIGFTLRMVPDQVWEPLSDRAKTNLANYLKHVREFDYVQNNWKFFRILVDMGLKHVGVEFDESLTEAYLEELDDFYLGDGWYRDGNVRRVDHYIPFAMHFYGLIYAALAEPDDPRAKAYRERAVPFARDIQHWFDEDGGTLAFGRSLTYRFACGGFWGALAFADVEALPWGQIKGQFLRHLRWWSEHPIADRDGVLSVGYGYPNLLMSESYNSAGSPYWALKAFLPLALPADHPFWTAEEEAPEPAPAPVPLKHPGMVMMRTEGNAVALSAGQHNHHMRHGAEKYAKFVYSSRYGFSVEADPRAYRIGAFDGMLGLSDDGWHWRVREQNDEALIADDKLYAKWRPWSDVTVETWLIPASPWHIRLHRIETPRALHGTEGGFAIARGDLDSDDIAEATGEATARTPTDTSRIVDLSDTARREARVQKPLPNGNLIVARTLVPQLTGEIPAGTTLLATAVMALPAGAADTDPPALPDLAEIEALFAERGVATSPMHVTERH